VTASLKMIAFVMILATALTGVLLAVEGITKPIITRNEEVKIKKNVLAALGVSYADGALESSFEEQVRIVTKGDRRYFLTAQKAVAFPINGMGLWGPIRGILAVEPDGVTIRGITIVHQEETPGLGSRIGEAAYLKALQSKRLLPKMVVTAQGRADGENEVDGITGATLSCQAFVRILNNEAAACLPAIEGLDP